MLEEKRVKREQESLLQGLDIADATSQFERAVGKVRRYMLGDAPNAIGAGQAFNRVGRFLRFPLFAQNGNDLVSILAYMNSLKFLIADLGIKKRGGSLKIGTDYEAGRALGQDIPMWQAAGWTDIAASFADDIWTTYYAENEDKADILFGNPRQLSNANPHANFYLKHKPFWFTTMTTVEESLWRQHGYDPDMDSLGAYWMLAQVWDDPDPAKVRNALLAVREHNIGTTFIKDVPEGNRVYLVDEFLLLYDYDIRSVNMRRKLMGLPVVEVEDYIYDMDLPLEVLPFAKDDVFYPAYVKMCAELGVEPYAPENSIDVRIDPETLLVSRV